MLAVESAHCPISLFPPIAVALVDLARRVALARASIGKAFVALADGRDMALAAELHRMRAVLSLRADASDSDSAEQDLGRALAIARRQGALSLELRAGRELARMLMARGKNQEAGSLLAPFYARFTEGFDTPDLLEVKALLDGMRD